MQCGPLLKLIWVIISEDAEAPCGGKADNVCLIALGLRAALRGVTGKVPWAGYVKGSAANSSGTQLSGDSFHSAA